MRRHRTASNQTDTDENNSEPLTDSSPQQRRRSSNDAEIGAGNDVGIETETEPMDVSETEAAHEENDRYDGFINVIFI